MRQHHPQGEAQGAEGHPARPTNTEKRAQGALFVYGALQSNVHDENLQQVRLNRVAIQADASASPAGRGPRGRRPSCTTHQYRKARPTGALFVYGAVQPSVHDENLQQVRLNRGAIQADASASPAGRGPRGRRPSCTTHQYRKARPTGALFVYGAVQSSVHDENLQQVRLNRGAFQADASAPPAGRGLRARKICRTPVRAQHPASALFLSGSVPSNGRHAGG